MANKILRGLPDVDPTETPDEVPTFRQEKARICDKCGNKEPRIVSNSLGVSAHCPCGNKWAFTTRPMAPAIPMAPARGIGKQTLVEPNWDMAFENLGGPGNDKIGPKR